VKREPKSKDIKRLLDDFGPGPYKRGELAKLILLAVAIGIIIPASIVMPGLPIALKPLLAIMKKNQYVTRQNLVKSITCLKHKRLVSVIEKDGQQVLTLSENGRQQILKFDLDKLFIQKPKRWDGLWRLVIFDIPERYKQGREALRDKLKHLGFYQLQKSCFLYPYECKKEIDFIIEIFQISPYINYILAKSIEGEKQLKKVFNIDH